MKKRNNGNLNKLEMIMDEYPDMDFLSADGFNDALIGVVDEKLVYSKAICLQILINENEMEYEEALEFFMFNIEGTYMGEKTPIWVDDEMFLSFS